MEINYFKINKLHESLNYELQFDDNTLILLGENGACKTTIIKMLYYILSLQWGKLSQYNFDSVEACINNHPFVINKDEILSSSLVLDDGLLRRLPPPIRRHLMDMIDREARVDWDKIKETCIRYGFPIEYIYQELRIDESLSLFSDSGSKKKKYNQFIKLMHDFRNAVEGVHILYLPTYRRIEQELKVVLEGKLDNDEYRGRRAIRSENSNYTELIEFGMKDVEDNILNNLTGLKESSRENLNQLTLGYLGDIVDEKYREVNADEIKTIDENTIHNIMNRVDESILSDERKKKLSDTLQIIKENGIQTDRDRVVCHYFLKLFESHKELQKRESTITDFANVCNKYLESKKARYDSPSFDFKIISQYDNKEIGLQQLSSGEKQVVSLFSHLYLSHQNNYIVLIDEPEMSLSVKWQKMFLNDVRKGGFCSGLIAVTHSPFIFENELDRYAHGLEEFKR